MEDIAMMEDETKIAILGKLKTAITYLESIDSRIDKIQKDLAYLSYVCTIIWIFILIYSIYKITNYFI
jgi:hypothetical protein